MMRNFLSSLSRLYPREIRDEVGGETEADLFSIAHELKSADSLTRMMCLLRELLG